jgi:hypothetical protein
LSLVAERDPRFLVSFQLSQCERAREVQQLDSSQYSDQETDAEKDCSTGSMRKSAAQIV